MTARKFQAGDRPAAVGDQIDRYLDRQHRNVVLDPPVTIHDACAAFVMVGRPGEQWVTIMNGRATANDYTSGSTTTASWLHRVGDPDGRWTPFPGQSPSTTKQAA